MSKIPYIGGLETRTDYDFNLKIAGSVTECPMKCYWARSTDLLLPTDSNWREFNQSNYNLLQAQDNTSAYIDATTVGEKAQFLIELNLTDLCNSVYGGNNQTLKQNLTSLEVDAWARGEGDNNGVKGYNIKNIVYRPTDGWAPSYYGRNNTDKIEKIKTPLDIIEPDQIPIWTRERLTADNKIYILLVSDYSASEAFPSKIWLDYVSIKLNLSRQPDKVLPIALNLGNKWSIVVKGVSYDWESTVKDKYLFWLQDPEKQENIAFRYISGNIGRFSVQHGSKVVSAPSAPSMRSPRWGINSYLFQYADNKYTMYHLDGEGIRQIEFPDTDGFKVGTYNLFIGQHTAYAYQADAFIEDLQLLDQTFNAKEAEVILRGRNSFESTNQRYNNLADIFHNPKLTPDFTHNTWAINKNASVSLDGKTLTLNATAGYQESYVSIDCRPNTKYKVKCKFEGDGRVVIIEKNNNLKVKQEYRILDSNGTLSGEFTTTSRTNVITVSCSNSTAGTFKYSDLEVRRLD